MSNLPRVVYLAEIRSTKSTYEEKSKAIDSIAPRYVSLGATMFLRKILNHAENAELSYTFLCNELVVTRKTLAKYIEELENAELLKVRRRRIGLAMAVNQFEIDFKNLLGKTMSRLPIPKKQRYGNNYTSRINNGVVEKVDGNTKAIQDQKQKQNQDQLRRFAQKVERPISRSYNTVEEALTYTEKRITRKRAAKAEKATTVLQTGAS